jgi:ABC-2 type transport system ATP-binding protein
MADGTDGTAISVQDLKMRYGDNEAVRGISFEVQRGEVFGFLGPNGAGKTTTIEILEGYRKRTDGDAVVLGTDPGRPTREWRERIGLVLQECELDPALTVGEIVTLFSSFYPSPRSVAETIDLVGLGDKRDARVGTLSGGQRRRVDVAVGIVGDPELVFLDEPTTGFDPSARRDAWNMIEGLQKLGKTIFLTTHYMDEAQHLADRVAILRRGELVAIGDLDEIGAKVGQRSVIRFRMPSGASTADIGEIVEAPVELSGEVATITVDNAQRPLYRLTGWAEERGIVLDGLEAVHPTLEDIFLELTDDGDRASRDAT